MVFEFYDGWGDDRCGLTSTQQQITPDQVGRRANCQYHGGADHVGGSTGRAGSFTMSAVDERRSLVPGATVGGDWGIIGNTPVDLGSFIVDNLSTDLTTPGAPELTVSGDDLLLELAQRTVGELGIYEDDLRVLGYFGGLTGANLAATVSDGDVATAVRTVVRPGNNTYLASQTQFNRVRFRFRTRTGFSPHCQWSISKRAARGPA